MGIGVTRVMWRAYLRVVVAVVAAGALLGVPTNAWATTTKEGPSGIYSHAAIVVTADGTTLWSKNPYAGRRVASTIKLLNALVVRDQAPLNRTIRVSSAAARIDNGTVGLTTGQKLKVRDLLSIMLVHSANDAACALGVGIAGSEKKYVAMMNAKAKALGLKNTKAADTSGLGGHETCCAADLSVLGRLVVADPVLSEIVQRRSCRVPRPGGGADSYSTTNGLFGRCQGLVGVKTGYTDPAGYCYVGAARRDGIELFCVVLGADSSQERFAEARRLLDWGFAHVSSKQMISRDETMGAVQIESGSESTVTVHPSQSLNLTVGDVGDKLSTRVVLPTSTPAPVSAGQRLGSVQVVRNKAVIASVPLVADAGVARKRSVLAYVSTRPKPEPKQPGFFESIGQMFAGIGHMLGM